MKSVTKKNTHLQLKVREGDICEALPAHFHPSIILKATSAAYFIYFTLKWFSQPKVQVNFSISFLEVTLTFSLNKCEPILAPSRL